VLFRSNY